MSNAFSGMEGIINSVNQRAVASNQHLQAKTNILSRNDEIMKTLGEAKVFISGKSIGQKVGQAIKARAKATAEKYVAQAKDGIQNQLNQRVGSRLDRLRGNTSETSRGTGTEDSLGDEELQDANTFRSGTGESGMRTEVTNNEPETSFTNEDGSAEKYMGDADEEVERVATKTATRAGAEMGGEEAGAGVLDAIPGLDVIGVIGGAIMAGIAEHKAHQAKEKMQSGQKDTGVSIGNEIQAGVGN